MTDRELLELAAKAAGIEGEYVEGKRIVTDCGISRIKGIVRKGSDLSWEEEWNPLEDDGDALRLAVKLGLSIHRLPNKISTSQYGGKQGYLGGWSEFDFIVDDETVTRRAIVRAAAELGKAMP